MNSLTELTAYHVPYSCSGNDRDAFFPIAPTMKFSPDTLLNKQHDLWIPPAAWEELIKNRPDSRNHTTPLRTF
ncbi:MAG: hypothetical protein NW224_11015 [Leptolyngbyaceae cyanobacterium bins.302]|nr:hypothetical protein [Leptolyngbyaceae cyanobacterium bins.302]